DRPHVGYISCRRRIGNLDDPSTLCICTEFSNSQILAITDQNNGHGMDFRRRVSSAYIVQLVVYAQVGVGTGGDWWGLIVVAQL
ncbi:Hypothetical predicted protein, partial [Olea europaea subsp. europaea]